MKTSEAINAVDCVEGENLI